MSPLFALLCALVLGVSAYVAGRVHAELRHRTGYRQGFRAGHRDGVRAEWTRAIAEARTRPQPCCKALSDENGAARRTLYGIGERTWVFSEWARDPREMDQLLADIRAEVQAVVGAGPWGPAHEAALAARDILGHPTTGSPHDELERWLLHGSPPKGEAAADG